jgi:hypothetical protein
LLYRILLKGYTLHAGDVVQLVRTLPCHGRGRGFESRRPRHILKQLRKIRTDSDAQTVHKIKAAP